jgi:hypothetical protein
VSHRSNNWKHGADFWQQQAASYTPTAAYSELPPAAAAVPSLTDKKQSKKITVRNSII